VVKNLPANEGDMGSVPRLRRSPGEGNGKCHGQRSWGATVHGVAKELDMT